MTACQFLQQVYIKTLQATNLETEESLQHHGLHTGDPASAAPGLAGLGITSPWCNLDLHLQSVTKTKN